jgi:F0F1-type ATP synthase assembly protein I
MVPAETVPPLAAAETAEPDGVMTADDPSLSLSLYEHGFVGPAHRPFGVLSQPPSPSAAPATVAGVLDALQERNLALGSPADADADADADEDAELSAEEDEDCFDDEDLEDEDEEPGLSPAPLQRAWTDELYMDVQALARAFPSALPPAPGHPPLCASAADSIPATASASVRLAMQPSADDIDAAALDPPRSELARMARHHQQQQQQAHALSAEAVEARLEALMQREEQANDSASFAQLAATMQLSMTVAQILMGVSVGLLVEALGSISSALLWSTVALAAVAAGLLWRDLATWDRDDNIERGIAAKRRERNLRAHELGNTE